jgi:hypothetical protein
MRDNPHHSYGITVKQGTIIRKGYKLKFTIERLCGYSGDLDKNRLTETYQKNQYG